MTWIAKATGFVKAVTQVDKSREYWTVAGTLSIVGGFFAGLLGGWDSALKTFMIFAGLDVVLGLIIAVRKKSPKSDSGGVNSFSFWRGISKKFVSLVFIAGATALDTYMGIHFVREAVIISYIAGEAISLAENAALLGAPIPDKWKQAIDVLAKKADDDKGE